MAKYICPYCGKEYQRRTSFAKHMKDEHGVERPFEFLASPTQPKPFDVEPVEPKTVKIPSKSKKKVGGGSMETNYVCGNCGEPLKKGWRRCPACGEELDWSAVKE